jgi:hypothetical protein
MKSPTGAIEISPRRKPWVLERPWNSPVRGGRDAVVPPRTGLSSLHAHSHGSDCGLSCNTPDADTLRPPLSPLPRGRRAALLRVRASKRTLTAPVIPNRGTLPSSSLRVFLRVLRDSAFRTRSNLREVTGRSIRRPSAAQLPCDTSAGPVSLRALLALRSSPRKTDHRLLIRYPNATPSCLPSLTELAHSSVRSLRFPPCLCVSAVEGRPRPSCSVTGSSIRQPPAAQLISDAPPGLL